MQPTLTAVYKVCENPPLLLGMNTLKNFSPPYSTSRTSHFASWFGTEYLALSFPAANNLTPNSRFGEMTPTS